MRKVSLAATVVASVLTIPATLLASNLPSGPMAQTAREPASATVSPPNAVTGPDFAMLMKMMRKQVTRCGIPRTATLHWHVRADGVIDDFVLNKSSNDACFDEVVILNADAVVKAQLRITPAMRNGVAEAAWLPFAVAARH